MWRPMRKAVLRLLMLTPMTRVSTVLMNRGHMGELRLLVLLGMVMLTVM